jgi:citrate lyase beta subunit
VKPLTIRSLLFAPGDDAKKLTKALASEADAVIADLEDGVGSARKDEARALVAQILSDIPRGSAGRLVRVNPGEPRDLDAIARLELDAIVLAKSTPDAIAALGSEGPPVIALVETASGVRTAFEIASSPRVAALMLGSLDLAAELGVAPDPGSGALSYAASKLVIDSAAARIAPPFDGVFADTTDEAGLRAEIERARRLGFAGKGCIHPNQVGPVNRGFASSADEVAWARLALDAYERAEASGSSVASLDGEMVDLPVVIRARRILEFAKRST